MKRGRRELWNERDSDLLKKCPKRAGKKPLHLMDEEQNRRCGRGAWAGDLGQQLGRSNVRRDWEQCQRHHIEADGPPVDVAVADGTLRHYPDTRVGQEGSRTSLATDKRNDCRKFGGRRLASDTWRWKYLDLRIEESICRLEEALYRYKSVRNSCGIHASSDSSLADVSTPSRLTNESDDSYDRHEQGLFVSTVAWWCKPQRSTKSKKLRLAP